LDPQVHFEFEAVRLSEEDVLMLLDYPTYFQLLAQPLPENRSGIIYALTSDGLISRMAGTGWRVTNLGGILSSAMAA
jgi:ATP-dependent DNA helicase RecG